VRVLIEVAPGEIRERPADLAKAIASVVEREGADPDAFAEAFAKAGAPAPAPSDLRPACLRESVAARLRWYETILLPAMQARIMEVLS